MLDAILILSFFYGFQPLVVEREFENPKAPYESITFMGCWIIIRKYNVYLLIVSQCFIILIKPMISS